MSAWYVVYTQPHGEEKAWANLERQGFAPYLPRYAKTRRHARRIETVRAPLFPRYLFVNLDLERARWRAILSTVGVISLVTMAERPAPVPDSLIDQISAREDASGLVVMPSVPPFRPGEPVRLTHGSFGEVGGIFQAMSDDDRVVVLLDLLGRQVPVEVARAAVASA